MRVGRLTALPACQLQAVRRLLFRVAVKRWLLKRHALRCHAGTSCAWGCSMLFAFHKHIVGGCCLPVKVTACAAEWQLMCCKRLECVVQSAQAYVLQGTAACADTEPRAGGNSDAPIFVAYGTACTVFNDVEVASALEGGAHLLQRTDSGATVDRYDVRLLLDAGACSQPR